MAGSRKIFFLFTLLVVVSLSFPHTFFAAAKMKEVDYPLPYPGLLPDNPIYPLKAFRDRLISFFISDPVKKADFDLLQADKRLNASLYLFNQSNDKETIISTTISKGENYFEEGIAQLRQAKSEGKGTDASIKAFTKAAQKHEQVLTDMELKASPQLKKDLASDVTRLMKFDTALAQLPNK